MNEDVLICLELLETVTKELHLAIAEKNNTTPAA